MKSSLRIFILLFFILPVVFYGQQIENPGFENWEDVGEEIIEPVDWSTIQTSDDPDIGDLAPFTYDRSDDAHTGNYALKLYNVRVFANLVATGAITNGRFHASYVLADSYSFTQQDDARWHTAFTARPDSLTGWFKYFPNGDDIAQFKVILHVDSCKLPENGTLPNWVGVAVYITDNGDTIENWKRFSVPFTYFNESTPEYILIVLNSGDSTTANDNSYLLVDDLELIYPSSGISDRHASVQFLIVAHDRLFVNFESEEEYLHQWFYLIDATGQTIITKQLEDNQVILPARLPQGIYVAVLKSKTKQYVQKVMIP